MQLPTSSPAIQTSALAGFKFSTIGQQPTLLQRMSDIPHIPLHHLSSIKNLSQKQASTSRSRSHPTVLQSFATGTSSVERDGATNLLLAQHANPVPTVPISALSSEPLNDIKKSPQSQGSIRASVVPDLQYPLSPREVELDPSDVHPQPTPMDEDTSHHFSHPPIVPPVSRPDGLSRGTGVVGGTPDDPTVSSPSISSQCTGNDTSIEPKKGRQPVEHLIKLASARDEQLSKLRITFDDRSGELSSFCTDAKHATRVVQDRIELLKRLAKETCAQAEQMLQEAFKTRNLSDRLMASIEVLNEDVLGANSHMGRATECSEQMARFVRVEFFDSLAALRSREKESIVVVETELAEQAAKESAPRHRERLQRQLGYQNADEQEKEPAKREAANRREEQCETVRKELNEEQHSGVMVGKPRANEAHAQSIQAERVLDTAGSSSGTSVRGSDVPLGVAPGVSPELINSAPSTSIARASPLPSQTSSHLSAPMANNEFTASPCNSVDQTSMCFDRAQTEIRPPANTDLSRSSTNSAPEMPERNVGEAPQHSCFGQVSREQTQEQVQCDASKLVAPKQEWQEIEIGRGSSVDQLPPERMQSPFLETPAEVVDTIDRQDRQQGVTREPPIQDMIDHQHARASSTSGLCSISLQAAQPEDQRQQDSYMSAPAPPQEEGPTHPQDSLHDRVVPTADARAHGRADSISSDRSQSPVNDRNWRFPSPPSYPRRPRSRSPSPSYPRKRACFGTPRGPARRAVDHWEPPRSREHWRSDRDWDRRWDHDHDRARIQADSPRHYRPPLSRRTFNTYSSPSPPPSPRPYRPERSSFENDFGGRPFVAEHGPRQFVDTYGRELRVEVHRSDVNSRRYDPIYGGARVSWAIETEEQQQMSSLSLSERNRTPTPPPRIGEADNSLLGRIDTDTLGDRRYGRGRPLRCMIRQGVQGSSSGSCSRGSVSPSPPLLSRISEIAQPTCMPPALSLSDRIQQD